MMTNSDVAKQDLELFREYRRLARNEGDLETRAKLLTKAREHLRRAAQADPVFVARASAEAAALLAGTRQMRRLSGAAAEASNAAHVIRPVVAAWSRS